MEQANLLVDDRPAARGSAEGPVRVGIAGLGRSGWGIHAEAIARQPERFRVAAVADGDAGCRWPRSTTSTATPRIPRPSATGSAV